jgi:hypothetical protein
MPKQAELPFNTKGVLPNVAVTLKSRTLALIKGPGAKTKLLKVYEELSRLCPERPEGSAKLSEKVQALG